MKAVYEKMTDHELLNACSIWSDEHRAAHIAEIKRRKSAVDATLSQCDTEQQAQLVLAECANF